MRTDETYDTLVDKCVHVHGVSRLFTAVVKGDAFIHGCHNPKAQQGNTINRYQCATTADGS